MKYLEVIRTRTIINELGHLFESAGRPYSDFEEALSKIFNEIFFRFSVSGLPFYYLPETGKKYNVVTIEKKKIPVTIGMLNLIESWTRENRKGGIRLKGLHKSPTAAFLSSTKPTLGI